MSQNISHGVAIGNQGCNAEENITLKVFNILNIIESQFLNMSITGINIEEIATNVINDMFMTFVIVLYRYHRNNVRSCSQIEEIITMIVWGVQ